jgi:hypothetical protein
VELVAERCKEEIIMASPKIYDIRNNHDAVRFGLSPTEPTRNSGGVPARDFLLSRCILGRRGARLRFIVLHIQEGSTPGSLEHWVAGRVQGSDG